MMGRLNDNLIIKKRERRGNKNINMRLDSDLYSDILIISNDSDSNVAEVIRVLLVYAVDKYKKENEDT